MLANRLTTIWIATKSSKEAVHSRRPEAALVSHGVAFRSPKFQLLHTAEGANNTTLSNAPMGSVQTLEGFVVHATVHSKVALYSSRLSHWRPLGCCLSRVHFTLLTKQLVGSHHPCAQNPCRGSLLLTGSLAAVLGMSRPTVASCCNLPASSSPSPSAHHRGFTPWLRIKREVVWLLLT